MQKFHKLVLGLVELIDAKGIDVALYGPEAIRHKVKNGLKTQEMHFLPVIELISDSLTAIKVKPHQCPLHQLILLIQGPIHEIFIKKY